MTTATARSGGGLAERLDALVAGEPIPWHALGAAPAEFVEACERSGFAELVHRRLAAQGGRGGWPDEIRQRLAREAEASAAVELVRGRELAAVLRALAEAGVRPILLKGTPLAYTIYDAPECRRRSDTDLLVRRRDLDGLRRTLVNLGYGDARQSGGELLFGQRAMRRLDALGVEHVVDVHWRVSAQPLFARLLPYDEIEAEAEAVPRLGPSARAAGPVHALLLACLHPAMHHRNAVRPLWVYDVHLLASRLEARGFDAFAELALDRRVATICAGQLALARARFGTSVPAWLTARLAEPRGVEPSAAFLQPGRRWQHDVASSLAHLGWRDRGRLLAEIAFPAPRYMLETYGIGGGGLPLLPALYLHRLACGGWKILRRLK